MVQYAKPLLTEILAEVHFGEAQLRGEQLVEAARLVSGITGGTVELEARPLVPSSGTVGAPILRSWIKLWSSDRQRLVQLTDDLTVVNLVGQYPGWSGCRAFPAGTGTGTRTKSLLEIMHHRTCTRAHAFL
jgi:hypothetical protein